MKALILVFISFLYTNLAISQTGRIVGKVIESETGQPLQDYHIFIPNTTYQAFSDSSGNFLLANVQEGLWEVQGRGAGYITNSQKITVKAGNSLNMTFSVDSGVEGNLFSSDFSKSKRKKFIKSVEEKFFKDHPSKDKVQLLNQDQLIFETQRDKNIKVGSAGPLFFSNQETAYLITIYFEPFILEEDQSISMTVSYFELPEEGDKESLRNARLAAYKNSPSYFLSQLMIGDLSEFSSDPQPEVSFSKIPGEYFLKFDTPLKIKGENGRLGNMSYKGEKLQVKLNGSPSEPGNLDWEGQVFEGNPIFGVPHTFNAAKSFQLANLEKNAEVMEERVYLHTDRRHYWPGEYIFFKAYLSYANSLLSEDLSKVLHVELIDTTGYVWIHEVVEINNGLSAGQLALPDLAETGNFFLRAYTSWSLNYERGEFILPIQILDHFSQPEASTEEFEIKNVGLFTDKQSYGGKEKVRLNLMITDEAGLPLSANLSVAVLDLKQAVYVSEKRKITDQLAGKILVNEMKDFVYPLEQGFELSGKLQDDDGQPIQGTIQAFINGYEDERKLKSDNTGAFSFPASNFEGEFEINLKATGPYNQPIRTIQLDLKSYPSEELDLNSPFPDVVKRGTPPDKSIRPISPLEEGEILLETAEVKASKKQNIERMIYGRPDNVVNTNEMNLVGTTLQFLYALMAKVPGMKVVGSPPYVGVRFRGGEPLVLINGNPANALSGGTFSGGSGQSVYTVLESINVYNIERIEVLRRIVPQYGDQGRNGIISIFLKTGPSLAASLNNFNLFPLQGFQQVKKFDEAIESRQNFPFLAPFRPTLYWNPFVITNERSLSLPIEFELNEIAGPFLVEIRGFSILGEPIYGTFVLNNQD